MSKRTNDPPASPFEYGGFTSPNYTQVPDDLFDVLLPELSGGELKVLLYIMRRTFGFKKDADDISLNQICKGITTHDGRVLDRGTGLSQSTVQLALKGLVEKKILLALKRTSPERGNEPTTYSLNLGHPFTENRQRGGPKIGEALHRKSVTQETVGQETERQGSNIRKTHAKNFDADVASAGRPTRTDAPVSPPAAAAPPSPSDGLGFQQLRNTVAKIREKLPHEHDEDIPDAAAQAASADPMPTRKRGRPPGSREDRDHVGAYLRDFQHELGDEAPLSSSISRALNILTAANMPPDRWADCLYRARSITLERSASITKKKGEQSNGFSAKNRAPFFFAVLEDICGLREQADSTISGIP